MRTFNDKTEITSAVLAEGDLVQILGNLREGDVVTQFGKVRTSDHVTINPMLPTANGLFVEVFPSTTDTGFTVVGDFVDGFHINYRNEVGQAIDGTVWRYTGALPFTVPAGTVPSPPTYEQIFVTDHDLLANLDGTGHDSIYARKFGTAAELEAFAGLQNGVIVTVEDRGGARYKIQAAGYMPKFGDITLSSGQVAAIKTDGVITTQNINGTSEAVIYVSTTGSDTNQGTASSPLATGQAAVNRLYELGSTMLGQFIIDIAAGTYPRIRFSDDGILSDKPIILRGVDVGGHPNVPTTIISEGLGVSAFGILTSKRTSLIVQDIKIVGYSGSSSSAAYRGNSGSFVFTRNVHVDQCYLGIAGYENATIDVKGGIIENNTVGIQGFFHTKWQVGTQNAGTVANGPIIRNNVTAARCQENSTGHIDYSEICDNQSGVRLVVNSRLNITGSEFKRNTASAIYGTQGCHVDPFNTVFGTGADANGRNWSGGLACSASNLGIVGVNTANSAAEYVFETDHPQLIINSTTNTVIGSYSLNESALNDNQLSGIACKKIGFRVTGSLSGTTGTFKRLILRFGSQVSTLSFSGSAIGDFYADFNIDLLGDGNQYISGRGINQISSPTRSTFVSGAVTGGVTISAEATVNNAADSITINCIEWYQRGF